MEKPMPSSTATQTRIPIFAPTKRVTRKFVSEVESQWGTAKIEGPLTQIHRSIIDILLTCYPQRRMAGGEIAVVFPMYGLLSRLGQSTGLSDRKWLKQKLTELRRASLNIKAQLPDGARVDIETGIINEHRAVQKDGTVRYGVVFSEPYVNYVLADIGIRYTMEQLSTILELDAVPQAVARFALTHRALNMTVTDIFGHIGVSGISNRAIRKHVKAVHDSSQALSKLGLQLQGEGKTAVLHRRKSLDQDKSGTSIPLVRNHHPVSAEPSSR